MRAFLNVDQFGRAGKTLAVDTEGSDETGLREYPFSNPFRTLEAACAAALSGDTVQVRAGSYIITGTFAKDGVTIEGGRNVVIARTEASTTPLLSDAGGAINMTIRGVTLARSSPSHAASIVVLSDASSVRFEWCDIQLNADDGTPAIQQSGGTLRLHGCRVDAYTGTYQGSAVKLEGGELVLQDTTLLTDQAPSVTSSTAQSFLAYGAYANEDPHANSTAVGFLFVNPSLIL